jgi:hypothetical protein
MKFQGWQLVCIIILALGAGCSETEPEPPNDSASTNVATGARRGFPERNFEISDELVVLRARPEPNPERNAYFGDLHVHTAYSFDAFAFGTTATPDDAYRYAMGQPLEHPAGFTMQLREPLDFYAVTDHAMFLGVAEAGADTSSDLSKQPLLEGLHDLNAPNNRGLLSIPGRIKTFSTLVQELLNGISDGSINIEETNQVTRSAWRDTIDAAEGFNDPGYFTTFVAYEYSSAADDRGNLHRNVIFGGGDQFPAMPFSRFHSQNPEGLWDWMDDLRDRGIESLAIPHNSNGSNGQMFELEDWAGNPMDDEYTSQRLRNEPLVEITQVKGTSETHPALSNTDEWANFEIMPYVVSTMKLGKPEGSYVRDALRRGLSLAEAGDGNPYQFGFIGSSDTHTGATTDDESEFYGKLGLLDAYPELRGSVPLPFLQASAMKVVAPDLVAEVGGEDYTAAATITYGASGLAAVWAEENTREAIFDAFRRKETFATSGPRIRMRFFAGFGFDENLIDSHDAVTQAYKEGVSMGGELAAESSDRPRFLTWAYRDPRGAPLQRLQIIKGWIDDGGTHEKVYDVACSDGMVPDPVTHRCADNGAKVDLSNCAHSTNVGDDELKAWWTDPEFDPGQRAFYYGRVLENPTCRWSTWDAIRSDVEPRPDIAKTLQERAWSSPIWIMPAGGARLP